MASGIDGTTEAFSFHLAGENDDKERAIPRPSADQAGKKSSRNYVYEPLDTTRRCIRLVRIQRKSTFASLWLRGADDSVACTISTFEVSTARPYVALSYTWGDPAKVKSISLNGKTFSVRENLYDFLATYRKTGKAPGAFLWIDQLCIDQSSTKERNHQVAMMASIYRKSYFVVAWLDRSSQEAARKLKKSWGPGAAHTMRLLQNRYFGRLWVVQEQLLARRLYFMCGEVWLEWNKIQRGVMAMDSSIYADHMSGPRWLFYGVERKKGQETSPSEYSNLYLCATRFAGQQCHDARDKVYGLLGLVHLPVGESMDIVVDYDKPLKEVYVDAVRHLFTSTGSRVDFFYLLSAAQGLAKNMLGGDDAFRAQQFLDKIVELGEGQCEISINQMGMRDWDKYRITGIGIDVGVSYVPGGWQLDRWWFEYDGKRYQYLM
jgi:hypothetical protein